MEQENKNYENPYRWVILALTTVTALSAISMPMISLSVLFDEIRLDLGLSLVQIGVIWASISATGLIMAIPGGLLSDRFGARWMLAIIFIGSGVLGLSRAFTVNYTSFLIVSFLFGLNIGSAGINLAKVVGNWFKPAERGFANGVFGSGFASGFLIGSFASATYFSPWLGGWRPVLILFGAISIAVGIAWFFVHPKEEVDRTPTSLMQALEPLREVATIRNLWLMGLGKIGVWGAIRGFTGYLPLYLRGIGWEPAWADTSVSLFFLVSLICVVPLSILSDRIGKRRPFFLMTSVVAGLAILLMGIVPDTFLIVLIALTGFSFDAFMSLSVAATTEVKGVSATLVGTAVGLVFMIQEIGGMFAPIIGNSLEQISGQAPFYFWGGLALLGILAFWFYTEEPLAS